MQTRHIDGVTIRPLRNGDTATVAALFARLSQRSRDQRFGGAKPRLSELELAHLARSDSDHHVLVAYVDGDDRPAGIARLVREGPVAEVACAVADVCQDRGIGTVLTGELTAVARAAGITELRATFHDANPRSLSLLARCGRLLGTRWSAGEREIAVSLDPQSCRSCPEPVDALSCLEKHWQNAVAHARLSVASGHVRPQLSVETSGLGYFNHELALRSFELLQTVPLERTRVCPGPRCGWLFIDRSKGGQRRWCDMATCGNAAKSRSHYRRKRQARRHT